MANKQVIDVIARFQGDISNISGAIDKIESQLGGIKLAPNVEKNFLNLISKLQNELSSFEAKAQAGVASMADSRALEKSGKKIIETYNQIVNQIKVMENASGSSFNKIFPDAISKEIKEATTLLQKYEKGHEDTSSKIEQENKKLQEQKKIQAQLAAEREKLSKKTSNITEDKYASLKSSVSSTKGKRTKAITQKAQAEIDIENAIAAGAKTTKSGKLDARVASNKQLLDSLKAAEEEILRIDQLYQKLVDQLNQAVPPSAIKAEMEKNTKAIQESKTATESIQAEIDKLKSLDVETFNQLVQKIKELTGIDITTLGDLDKDIKNINTSVNNLKEEQVKKTAEGVKEIGDHAREGAPYVKNLQKGMEGVGDTTKELTEAEKEVEQLKNNILQFFSIGNAVELFKRAVRGAFETVKELDATMTEAAVVTDFSVGDMWDMLPQYSAEATKLGARINDLYGATTLYLQQGLQMNAALAVGTETMKMARIAGMDATEATQAMTAALRGFNMEINEMSAQRVNDVYSELAAITAADTSQIATAMSKTASIAASANMEFETTSALLAQIIETTQEAPETAGTALKTIIARFSEVKKLASEGQTTGTDSEGEAIDVNNIQKALRTVGISMDDFFAGTEGLDSVLMRLAEKWNTLDFETQRYIATTAAGSRQQSRFIAMMSDYERTVELANAANSSAGASQEQFNKTLDSLESKLNQLKNAWDQFLMGLSNNEIIKMGVDLLTTLLETINSITDGVSGGSGLVKSLVSLGTVLGGLKLGKGLLSKGKGGGILGSLFGGNLSKDAEKKGQEAKDSFLKGFKSSKGQGAKARGGALLGDIFTKQDVSKQMEDYRKAIGDNLNKAMQEGNLDGDKIADVQKTFNTDGADAAIKKAQQYGITLDENTQKSGKFAQATELNMNAIGASIAGVGMAMTALGGLFEEDSFGQKLFEGLGTTLTVVGSLLPLVAMGAKAMGFSFTTAGVAGVTAGTAVQAAWWPITLIIAAIAGLIVLFAALGDAAKKASIEYRMEQAAERTKAAQEAAEGAKEAYDNLLGEQSEYNELQETLEGLTKGTNEWKQALIDANQQVLKLLTTYPELAKYISRGEDGQLTISDEGWDTIIEEQEQDLKNANAAVLGAQINESNLKTEAARLDLEENFKYYDQDSETMKTDTDALEASRRLMAENPEAFVLDEEGNYSSELQALADQYNVTADQIYNAKDALLAYDEALLQNEITTSGLAESLLSTQASEDTNKSRYKDELISGFSKQMQTDQYSANIEKQAGELNDKNNEDVKALMKREGVQDTGDATKNLEALYAELVGITTEDIPEHLKGNSEALAKEIATIEQSSGVTKNMEEFRKRLDGLDKETADAIAKTMSRDSNNVKLSDLDSMKGTLAYYKEMGYGSQEEMAKAMGYQDTEFKNLTEQQQRTWAEQKLVELGEDDLTGEEREAKIQELISDGLTYNETISATAVVELDDAAFQQEVQEEYDEAAKTLQGKHIATDQYEDLAVGTVSNLSKQVADMSEADAQAYIEGFNEVLNSENLSEDQKKQLESYLSTIDWSDMTQATEAMDYMQSMGIDPSIMQNYWQVATEGANAYVKSLSEALQLTDRLQKKIAQIGEVSERLTSGKGTYEDMQMLIEAGADISQFQLTPDGWYATEEAIEDSLNKLREYHAEQARGAAEAHRNKFNSYQEIQKSGVGAGKVTTWNEEEGVYESADLTNVAAGDVEKIAEQLEIERGADETYDEYLKRLQAAYDSYINILNNGEDIQVVLDKQEAMAEAARYSTDENASQGGTAESVRYSMQNEATENGLDAQEVTSYSEGLKNIKELEDASQQMRDRIAIDNALLDKGVADLIEGYNDWAKEIEAGPGNPKYAAAVNSLRASADKLLGSTEGLSDEWLTNAKNMKLFERASKGDLKAIDELRREAAKQILINAGIDMSNLSADEQVLINMINNFDASEIKIGASLDSTGMTEAFNALIEGGILTADQVNAALEKIGFEPEITYKDIPVEQLNYSKTTGTAEVINPITGQKETVTAENVANFAQNGMVRIPVINGSTTTFSGSALNTVAPSTTNNAETGGGGDKSKKWENPYDEYYNVTEKLNEELRKREKLERDYDRILKNRKASLDDIRKNQLNQIATLRKEIDYQKQLVNGKKKQLQNAGKQTYTDEEGNEKTFSELGVTKYAKYDQKKGTIVIDWKAIDKITDAEKGAAVEAYISYLEEISGQLEEAEDAIWDCEDQIEEIKDQNKESYLELEQRVYDAIVDREQKRIDELQNLSDAIDEANNELLSSVRESIDLERQIRDNTKKEEDIQEKENRLAYLRMDTSGASDLEIKKLEEELANDREAYQDSIIDQKLDGLEKDAQKAQEQRAKQIEIMQAQLDYQAENGEFWGEVSTLLNSAFNKDGSLKNNSELVKLLKSSDAFAGLSEMGKEDWIDKLVEEFLTGMSGFEEWKVDKARDNNEKITFANGHRATYNEKTGKWENSKYTYEGVRYNAQTGQFEYDKAIAKTQPKSTTTSTPKTTETPKLTSTIKKGVAAAIWSGGYGWGTGDTRRSKLKEVFGADNGIQDIVNKGYNYVAGMKASDYTYEKMRKKFKGYKTGGLADFTGPAWLDGTKSKPEIVLNAQDSKNFIVLKDALSSLINNGKSTQQSGGDNYFDIQISVDELSNDYDVDKLAERIKKQVYDDSIYRNVNTINFLR